MVDTEGTIQACLRFIALFISERDGPHCLLYPIVADFEALVFGIVRSGAQLPARSRWRR